MSFECTNPKNRLRKFLSPLVSQCLRRLGLTQASDISALLEVFSNKLRSTMTQFAAFGQAISRMEKQLTIRDRRIEGLEEDMKALAGEVVSKDLIMAHNRTLTVILAGVDPKDADADLSDARWEIEKAEAGFERWGADYVL